MKLVRQGAPDECGLACLVMIANHHGHAIGLADLRRRYAHLDRGPTLATLLATATALKLDARAMRASLGELRRLPLPAVLHWEFRHFVVVTRVRRKRLVLLDPAVGRRSVSFDEASRCFTGVAVSFSRMPGFLAEAGTGKLRLRDFLATFDGLARYVGLMALLLLASNLLGLAVPVAIQVLVDSVIAGGDRRWLARVIAGIALIMLGAITIDALRRHVALACGIRLTVDTATALIRRVLGLPALEVERRTVGDLKSRVDSLAPVQRALTESAASGVVATFTLATSLSVMLFYSPRLALVSLAALVAGIALQYALLPAMRARNLDAVVAAAAADQSLIESLRAFAVVRSFALGAARLQHWQTEYLRASSAKAAGGRLAIATATGQSVIAAADQLLFLGLGVTAVAARDLTLGALFALFALRGRLAGAALDMSRVISELYLARAHLDRVGELLAAPCDTDRPCAGHRAALRGAVACSGLAYRYPGGADVLAAVDLEVAPGERLVICGPSGAGKSTLLRLLMTDLAPDEGSLSFDGFDSAIWDREALRAQFGVVQQNDTVFRATIADNISCFERMPDVPRIRDAARRACIWDDIVALPMKLDTPLASNGAGLSGGQLQRLLIARALYRRPRILFLDEATNQLDRRTERRVLGNIAAARMTVISVAHGANAVALGGRRFDLPCAAHGNRATTLG